MMSFCNLLVWKSNLTKAKPEKLVHAVGWLVAGSALAGRDKPVY